MGIIFPINLLYRTIVCLQESMNIMDPGVNMTILGFMLNLGFGLILNFGIGINKIPGLESFNGYGF